jgi:hypothetical protein
MWTKNGEATLDIVLKRINQVIPESQINMRFIVDDKSTDKTRKIAYNNSWGLTANKGTGISDGANTALDILETDYFCSFEQDLLLSKNWWNNINKYITDPKMAAVSGVRFASKPRALSKLQCYVYSKYRGEQGVSSWLRSRQLSSFTLGKTLDNTLWNRKLLCEVGGFPKLECNSGIDTVLAYKFQKHGYNWIVDYSIKSTHLRSGLRQELQHQYAYAKSFNEIRKYGFKSPVNKLGVLYRFFTSPATGIFMAYKMRDPNIAWIHPLIKFAYTKGILENGE